MKIKTEKLIKAIQAIQPAVASKEIIHQSNMAVFTGSYLVSYDNSMMVRHPFESDFKCAAPFNELQKFLNKTKDESVSIDLKDTHLELKGKRFRASLVIESDIQLPISDIPKPQKWETLTDDLIMAMKLCADLVRAGGMGRPEFTCLYFNKTEILSCDSFRLTKVTLDKKMNRSFLLPAEIIPNLFKFNLIKYSVSKDGSWIHFLTEDKAVISARLLEGIYPNISGITDENIKGSMIRFPDSTDEVLDRAIVFALDELSKQGEINVSIKDDVLTIRSENTKGRFNEVSKLDKPSKQELSFNIDPVFLKEILSHTKKAMLVKDKKRLIFKPEKHWIHIVSL